MGKYGNKGGYFFGCDSLYSLGSPDLSGTSSLSYAFYGGTNLEDVSCLNKWNTSQVKDMSSMFFSEVSSLKRGLEELNTGSVFNMNYIHAIIMMR